MKIYTVYIPAAAPDAQQKAIFLREGFSWSAFLFTGFWALYHRLWWPMLGIFLFNGALVSLQNAELLSPGGMAVLQLGFQVLVGFHANDWLRDKFAHRGYILADVTVGDSLLRAEQRYFERVLVH